MTFKLLYYSETPEFNYAALILAEHHMLGRKPIEYNAWYQIKKHLEVK